MPVRQIASDLPIRSTPCWLPHTAIEFPLSVFSVPAKIHASPDPALIPPASLCFAWYPSSRWEYSEWPARNNLSSKTVRRSATPCVLQSAARQCRKNNRNLGMGDNPPARQIRRTSTGAPLPAPRANQDCPWSRAAVSLQCWAAEPRHEYRQQPQSCR